MHIVGDGVGQLLHVGAGGAAMIDDDQRLAGMAADRAEALALPAALVDQPAGRQLDATVGLRVVRCAGVGGEQAAQAETLPRSGP